MLGDDSANELLQILHDLKKTMVEFKEKRTSGAQVVNQHVNAGGHAVWVVVVMAAIIFTAAIQQGPRISNLERKADRLQDYLNAIYQQAPGLKEKVESDVNDHHYYKASEGSESQ